MLCIKSLLVSFCLTNNITFCNENHTYLNNKKKCFCSNLGVLTSAQQFEIKILCHYFLFKYYVLIVNKIQFYFSGIIKPFRRFQADDNAYLVSISVIHMSLMLSRIYSRYVLICFPDPTICNC